MNLTILVLYIAAFATLLLGVSVWLHNTTSRLNRRFVAVTIAASAWTLTNALFTQFDYGIAYGIGLASYAAAAACAVTFFYFAAELSENRLGNIVLLASIVFVIVAATPRALATGVTGDGIQTTPMIYGYALGLVSYFVAGIILLVQRVRGSRGRARAQARLVLAGFTGAIAGGMTFNLIMPILGSYQFVELGPVFTLIFTGACAFGIVKHRLFAVRAAIARSLVYVLTLGTLTLGVTVIVIFGTEQLVDSSSFAGKLVYIAAIVVSAVAYQPLKLFFDTLTRRIFFKDFYESKKVLAALGDVAAHQVLPDALLRRSLTVLGSALHPLFIDAYVAYPEGMRRVANTGKHRIDIEVEWLKHLPKKPVVVLEELQGPNTYHEAIEQLQEVDAAVILRLATSRVQVGTLVVGYKLSGEAYDSRDVQLLQTVADELAVAVQNSLRFEEISRFNERLQREIHDATTQLRASNRRLQQLDAAKDEFISMASHQLRTPLTSVKGYLSMALEGDVGKLTPAQRNVLEEAYASAQRMVYMIADFLNISRLQTGKFTIEPGTVQLQSLIAEEIAQLTPAATARGIRLMPHIGLDVPILNLDESKIRQVIMNLIDNAIFYSHSGGEVVISLSVVHKKVVFSVSDHGIGVPPRERRFIFTKFYRATNARHIRPDGTGVGLFMAKKVIDLHGGEVVFETETGKGSTFGFTLPLRQQTD